MLVTIQTVTVKKEYIAAENELISDILSDCGVSLPKPCGGRGVCGKCAVRASGSLSPLTSEEIERLSPEQIQGGFRLACRARVTGEAFIDASSVDESVSGVTKGVFSEFEKDPLCSEGYGAAVDIGTSTVAMYFYKMPECEFVKSLCVRNAQCEFGADVVSRTEFAINGGAQKLKEVINNQIKRETEKFGESINAVVLTGNTTMLHLYEGLPVDTISVYPFKAKSLFGEWRENTYIPSCISAYVGADITCAVLACGMTEKDKTLLIDIGTNGEMAYYSNGKLVCCSTAAGPAFEGAGVSAGMVASAGAIDSVKIKDGKMRFTVIGRGEPIGICGSGLIDAVSCMKDMGVIDATGYLDEPYEIGGSGVFITPQDIRAVQLAKAAIRAGIDTLCPDCDEVSQFFIAGGFGSFVNISSCVNIGLIPASLAPKAKAVGNAAGSGASMILQSKSCLAKSAEIARAAETAELSLSPVFAEKYIGNMYF